MSGHWVIPRLAAVFNRGEQMSPWRELDADGEVTWPLGEVRGHVDSYGLASGLGETVRPMVAYLEMPVFMNGASTLTLTIKSDESGYFERME